MEDWGSYKFGIKEDNWPKDEQGEQVKPAFLEHINGSELTVQMEINRIKSFEIPVFYTYPNNGEFGKLILGLAGTGVDIYVPETMIDEAREIINSDFSDIEPEDE